MEELLQKTISSSLMTDTAEVLSDHEGIGKK